MKSGWDKAVSKTRAPLSAALVLLLLVLQALAASAPLHQDLHSEASHPGHECAVTLLSSGHVDLSGPGLSLPPTPVLTLREAVQPPPAVAAQFLDLPSSRGPPALA